jgi:hypothetical protein
VTTWEDVTKGLVGRSIQGATYSSIHQNVLTPGERIDVFVVRDADEARVVEASWARVTATICYCSVFDDCWSLDEEGTKPVVSCPTPGATSFKQ